MGGGENPWLCGPGFRRVCLARASRPTLRGGPKDVKNSPWSKVQGGTSPLYIFIVVSTAVDSFPMALPRVHPGGDGHGDACAIADKGRGLARAPALRSRRCSRLAKATGDRQESGSVPHAHPSSSPAGRPVKARRGLPAPTHHRGDHYLRKQRLQSMGATARPVGHVHVTMMIIIVSPKSRRRS